jgi:hypothetical protein
MVEKEKVLKDAKIKINMGHNEDKRKDQISGGILEQGRTY